MIEDVLECGELMKRSMHLLLDRSRTRIPCGYVAENGHPQRAAMRGVSHTCTTPGGHVVREFLKASLVRNWRGPGREDCRLHSKRQAWPLGALGRIVEQHERIKETAGLVFLGI